MEENTTMNQNTETPVETAEEVVIETPVQTTGKSVKSKKKGFMIAILVLSVLLAASVTFNICQAMRGPGKSMAMNDKQIEQFDGNNQQGQLPGNNQQGQLPGGQMPGGNNQQGQMPNGQAPNGQAPNGQAPNSQDPRNKQSDDKNSDSKTENDSADSTEKSTM